MNALVRLTRPDGLPDSRWDFCTQRVRGAIGLVSHRVPQAAVTYVDADQVQWSIEIDAEQEETLYRDVDAITDEYGVALQWLGAHEAAEVSHA